MTARKRKTRIPPQDRTVHTCHCGYPIPRVALVFRKEVDDVFRYNAQLKRDVAIVIHCPVCKCFTKQPIDFDAIHAWHDHMNTKTLSH